MSERTLRFTSPVRSRRLTPLRSRMSTNALPNTVRNGSPVRVASPTRRPTLRRTSPVRMGRTVPARRTPTRRASPARMGRNAPARRTPTRRASPARKTTPRRVGKGSNNPWVKFIKAHTGQGLTFKELSRMYRGM